MPTSLTTYLILGMAYWVVAEYLCGSATLCCAHLRRRNLSPNEVGFGLVGASILTIALWPFVLAYVVFGAIGAVVGR